jgi:hypothetical protein
MNFILLIVLYFFNFDLLLNKRQACLYFHFNVLERRIDYTPDIVFMVD